MPVFDLIGKLFGEIRCMISKEIGFKTCGQVFFHGAMAMTFEHIGQGIASGLRYYQGIIRTLDIARYHHCQHYKSLPRIIGEQLQLLPATGVAGGKQLFKCNRLIQT